MNGRGEEGESLGIRPAGEGEEEKDWKERQSEIEAGLPLPEVSIIQGGISG